MSPAPVSTHSAEIDGFLKGLIECKVLDSGRARSAWDAFQAEHPSPEVPALAEFLIARGLLTTYQAERATAGEATKLLLGPYLLLEPLGEGHLGSMYLALHRGDRRRFAVKVLPIRSLWKILQAKKQTALYQSLPAHSALVPLADIDTANGSHYLAWPFVEGETLQAILRDSGPWPVSEARRIFSDVTEALAICHQSGMFHGLLNPGNIAIGFDGKPRILDLGIGAILAENFDDESILDTISTANSALDMMDYCAPETINDPAARNSAADTYSLGCTFYAALTGNSPFPEGSVVDKMIAHQSRQPTRLREIDPSIPADFESLIDSMMRKDPVERPSLREVKLALDAIGVGLPVDPPSTVALGKMTLGFDQFEALLAEASAPETPIAKPPTTEWAARRGDTHPKMSSEGLIDFDALGSMEPIETPVSHRSVRSERSARPKAPSSVRLADSGTSIPDLLLPEVGSPNTMALSASPAPPPVLASAMPAAKKSWQPLPAPVNWTTTQDRKDTPVERPSVVVPPPPQFQSALVRGLRRQLQFWKPSEDTIQLSIFGAPEIAPGQRVNFLVYAHSPEIYSNVLTLCRAMRPDAELLGAGYLTVQVRRGVDVSLHLALAHAGVAKSLLKFTWIGQTQPRTFEVFVPWESPPGLTSGVVTAGIDKTVVASVPLHFLIPARQM